MKIAVVGCGHMGSWLAGELTGAHEVAGVDVDPARVEATPRVALIRGIDDLAAFEPQLVVNAVPLRQTIEVFRKLDAVLPPDVMLGDVASIKGDLPDFYRQSERPFVSAHPMFGPTFANIESLSQESAVIIRESDPTGAALFRGLFEARGLSIFEYSFDEHDRMMAYSLTLPFVSTMVFGACMDDKAVPGTTFRKHREIAHGLMAEDDYLLAEILFNPHSMEQIERVTSRLEFLKHVIRARDSEEAIVFFDRLRANLFPADPD
ncbi:MAG: prephenate dehydrogenase [Deltaproteobacteria bacterium]|nr:prephenate dehydrogenase [Deltaproteobacteria bacterium]